MFDNNNSIKIVAGCAEALMNISTNKTINGKSE